MNRHETLNYFLNLSNNGKRIIFSRYGDGEYFLMTGKKRCAKENLDIGVLLKKAIKGNNQLICTVLVKNDYNELISMKTPGKWGNTQKYIIEESQQNEIYGVGAFLRADYLTKCILLPQFFTKKVLIVTGHYKETIDVFKKEKINIDVFKMKVAQASIDYIDTKKKLIAKVKNYNNIIFSCGPIGKVLISDLANICDSNLIDFGSMLNVILSKHYKNLMSVWSISWAKDININKHSNLFFFNTRRLLDG